MGPTGEHRRLSEPAVTRRLNDRSPNSLATVRRQRRARRVSFVHGLLKAQQRHAMGLVSSLFESGQSGRVSYVGASEAHRYGRRSVALAALGVIVRSTKRLGRARRLGTGVPGFPTA